MSETEIKTRILQLKDRAKQIPTFKVGDIIESRWHNEIVDILREMSEILDQIPIVKEIGLDVIYILGTEDIEKHQVEAILNYNTLIENHFKQYYIENLVNGTVARTRLWGFSELITDNSGNTYLSERIVMDLYMSYFGKGVYVKNPLVSVIKTATTPIPTVLRKTLITQRYALALIKAFRSTTVIERFYHLIDYPDIVKELVLFGILISNGDGLTGKNPLWGYSELIIDSLGNTYLNEKPYMQLYMLYDGLHAFLERYDSREQVISIRWNDLTHARSPFLSQEIALPYKAGYEKVVEMSLFDTYMPNVYAETQIKYELVRGLTINGEIIKPKVENGTWVIDNNTYHYRVPIKITEQSGNDLTDYTVKVVIPTSYLVANGYSTSTGNEVRFADENGNLLSFYRENEYNRSDTIYWIKIPNIPANSTIKIYMYIDPALTDVPDGSDPENTFIFYEDFTTDPNTNGKWQVYRSANDSSTEFVYDSANRRVYLTKAVNNRGCFAFLKKNGELLDCPEPGFAIMTRGGGGGGSGADGWAIAFYKDPTPYQTYGRCTRGGSLGLGAYDGSNSYQSKGYEVEFDNYRNSWSAGSDPSANHNALSDTFSDINPVTHHARKDTNIANEDNKTHDIEIYVYNGCKLIVDGEVHFSVSMTFDKTYTKMGVGAGTGGLNNNHWIQDYFIVRKYVDPEPLAEYEKETEPVTARVVDYNVDEYATIPLDEEPRHVYGYMSKHLIQKAVEQAPYHEREKLQLRDVSLEGTLVEKRKYIEKPITSW